MTKQRDTNVLAIRCPDELREMLDDVCQEEGVTPSEFIREAISERVAEGIKRKIKRMVRKANNKEPRGTA